MFSLLVVFNAADANNQFYAYNVTTHPSVLHAKIGDQIGNISYWSKTNIKDDNKTMQCNPTDPGFCFFTYAIEFPWVSRKLASDKRYVDALNISNEFAVAQTCSNSQKLEPETGRKTDVCAAYSIKSCNIPPESSATFAIEQIRKKISPTAKLYPDCYSLLSNFGCLVHHPNFKYMTTIAKVGDATQSNKEKTVTFHYEQVNLNVRVCRSFANELYDKCRYVGSIDGDDIAYGDRWIVEPGMGIDDFYKKLRIFWFNQSDPEQMDYPGVNCWSSSSSDQKTLADLNK